MMSPIENYITSGSVDCLDRVTGGFGEISCVEILDGLANLPSKVIASRCVVRMPENSNIRVKGFQGLSRVLVKS